MNIQTPQAFRFKTIHKAHYIAKYNSFLDDTSLLENIHINTKFIKGEKTNFKITYLEDIYLFHLLLYF